MAVEVPVGSAVPVGAVLEGEVGEPDAVYEISPLVRVIDFTEEQTYTRDTLRVVFAELRADGTSNAGGRSSPANTATYNREEIVSVRSFYTENDVHWPHSAD